MQQIKLANGTGKQVFSLPHETQSAFIISKQIVRNNHPLPF